MALAIMLQIVQVTELAIILETVQETQHAITRQIVQAMEHVITQHQVVIVQVMEHVITQHRVVIVQVTDYVKMHHLEETVFIHMDVVHIIRILLEIQLLDTQTLLEPKGLALLKEQEILHLEVHVVGIILNFTAVLIQQLIQDLEETVHILDFRSEEHTSELQSH